MQLYYQESNYALYQGNMLDMLEVIESNTIDSIVTDPPYELNFMNKGWDSKGVSFQRETWKKCWEVLKPGGYLLAFGGSRTFHRIACAIEDAGFEMRDTIMWLYGSGFPKSQNIGKTLEKKINTSTGNIEYWKQWGSCLKPSFEPIIVARKPFKGSLVDNVIEHGVGGLNIDECRISNNKNEKLTRKLYDNPSWKNCSKAGQGSIDDTADKLGRFPANTILTYDETDFDEVCGGFPYTKGDNRKAKPTYNKGFWGNAESVESSALYADSGSASRYFYCAKASKKDRDEGLDLFNCEKVNDGRNTPIDNPFQRGETPRKNTHPTVKPTELMQYLVRLVTPNNGVVLDPFNGSGSTGKAVMYENVERNKNLKYIGIELAEEYLSISKARIDFVINNTKPYEYTIFDYEEECV